MAQPMGNASTPSALNAAAAVAAVQQQLPLRHLATPEEREMMQDPTTVNKRVFVGLLPTEQMTKQNLIDLFAVFGPVAGVQLNRGFGFVQFENEQSAKDAIAANSRMHFRGKRIDVKPARPIAPRKPFNAGGEQPYVERDRSPIGLQDRENFHLLGQDKGREPTRFPVKSRVLPGYGPSTVSAAVDRTNDCEIIVIKKEQTNYAEFIESKLRKLGLTVDLLFPNEDCPVSRVITNIANRGCLFAVVIQPQNEEHRSITLNILHGPQQEHRNMPFSDAMALISRSFESYLLREKTTRPTEIPVVSVTNPLLPKSSHTHPENIQVLLNLLADNRVLTVLQYDKLVSYLKERREIQVKIELGESVPVTPAAPIIAATSTLPITSTISTPSSSTPSLEKQAELQSRILSILNTKAAAIGPAPTTATSTSTVAPSATTSSTSGMPSKPPILADPAVQKALSSLFPGNNFRNLAASNPTPRV